jgi:Universal stress protein family
MKKVVVSVDGSEASRAAVHWCTEHLPPETTVIAICGINMASTLAMSVPPISGDSTARIRKVFRDDWCGPLAAAGFDLRTRLIEEDDASALLEAAAKEDPDALVIGKEKHHTLADLFVASPLHRLLHHLPCALIVVPSD